MDKNGVFRQKIFFSILAIIFLQVLVPPITVNAEIPPTQEWIARYDNGGTDVAFAFTTDKDGNSYVTGASLSDTRSNYDFVTVKYNPSGDQLWVGRYDSGGDKDQSRAVTVDTASNVYIAGPGYFGPECTTIKYDKDGNQLWVARYSNASVARDILADTQGNVYVLCLNHSSGVHSLVKYNASGNKLWATEFTNRSFYEDIYSYRQLHSLFIDSSGYIYITTNTFNGVNHDFTTVKFDQNGNKLWQKNYDNGSFDSSRAVSVDDLGNVYVTGQSFNSLSGIDYATIKYDSNGNQLWVVRYDSGADDRSIDILLGPLRDIYVTGSDSGGSGNIITVKYDQDGNQLWVVKNNDNYGAIAISDDALGNIYVLGNGSLVKYNLDGEKLWNISVRGSENFKTERMGDIYVGGSDCNLGNCDYITTKYTHPVFSAHFWSPLQNLPKGWLNLHKTPGTLNKPTGDIIKTVPNDWVLRVATTTDATGNPIELDGYEWYGVVDSTDNALGWMTAKELSTGTAYLSYDANTQASLEAKARVQLITKEARIPIVLQSVDDYYLATTSNSLYTGGGGYDGLNNFQRFIQGASYPKELVLAIAGHESAGTIDNEICSSARDGGIGIMQITSMGFKGLGSALKNYPKTSDCRTNSSTSAYYSNVFQGIYANIKDGFRVLQEKYRKKCPDAGLTVGTLVYSCQDIERVLITWGYNGKVLTGSYLKQISNSLRDLSKYFPGVSYANNDQLIEKLALANSHRIEFKKFSPVEIEATDQEGRITGFSGEEIPFSAYDKESDGGVIFFPQNQNQYAYRVIGTGTGTYDFKVESTESDILHTVSATNIPVIPNEIYEYSIDWDALLRGERGVTVKIDENGNGVFERIVKSDGTLIEVVPPTVSITSPSGEYLLNAIAIAKFTATDDSGIAVVNATLNDIPVTNGQSLTLTKPGKNIMDVSAMDNEGNTATSTNIFSVVYNIKGFLSPSKNNETEVNRERTFPVKFKLYDVKGKLVSKAKANLYISKITDGVVGVDEIPRSSNDKDDKKDDRKFTNQFRYDSEEKQYIFSLSTKQMSRGTWQIKAVLDSGQEIVGKIVIK